MSFLDIEIQPEYRSLIDNIAKDFYIPLLNRALMYKRSVGFFSSSALIEISKGISGLVRNGGHIQLVASPYLSPEDIKAIKTGYENRDVIIKKSIYNELSEPINEFESERLNILANLISQGILDIKIAFIEDEKKLGMYHEKMGIIEDEEGNKVAFSGSMNESSTAMTVNYETIDVFRSWNIGEETRVSKKERAFSSIWNDSEPNITIIDFPDLKEDIIKKYQKDTIDFETFVDAHDELVNTENYSSFFKIPEKIVLHDYQQDAIKRWFENQNCGILDMATGSGKTITCLGCLSKLSESLNEKLAVVIVVPYQHLVEQWVEDIVAFNVRPIIAYSYPGQNWRQEFADAVSAYNVKAIDNLCIITTNATFVSNDFQLILSRFKRNFCFVADEAHNLGAKKISELLPKKARYRLALSATIDRFRDEEGTESLKKYFGRICLSFSLKDAINRDFLTSYYYHPIVVYLDIDELEKYKDLTKQIIKNGGANPEKSKNKEYLELLLIKRARIIAGCRSKIDKLIEVIEPYKDCSHMLVYCGATKYDNIEIDDNDQIKQIDAVNMQLYEELKIKTRKFTSSENKEERAEIIKAFAEGKDLQAITAIKCLDEGVNIPAIQKAFILASSTNPKEYIQRRGRVLRKHEGKEYAEIFDFITLPRPLDQVAYCSSEELEYDLSLVKKEFNRMLEFAETARNPLEIDQLKEEILNTYSDITKGGLL